MTIDSSSFELLAIEQRGRRLDVTIDAPPMNVMTIELYAELDRLSIDLEAASRETSDEARNSDYNRAEQILADQAPIAPIYQYTNGRLIKPWVKGYPITNPEDVAYSRELWIEKH